MELRVWLVRGATVNKGAALFQARSRTGVQSTHHGPIEPHLFYRSLSIFFIQRRINTVITRYTMVVCLWNGYVTVVGSGLINVGLIPGLHD